MLDGNEIGKATANEDGAFVVVPNAPLPSGSGTLKLKSKPAGETDAMESEQSVAVVVPAGQSEEAMVAVLSPNEPTRVLQKPAAQPESPAAAPAEQPKAEEPTQQAATPAAQPEAQPQQPAVQPETQAQQPAAQPTPPAQVSIAQVSLDAVDYDAAGNITFSGTAAPGATARLYVDNNFLGDATAGSDGRWVFNGSSPITPGIHSLRVDGVDANGAVTSRVEQPFFREEQSKVASAEPAQPEHSEPIPAPATPAAEEGKTDQQAAQPATPAAPATTRDTRRSGPSGFVVLLLGLLVVGIGLAIAHVAGLVDLAPLAHELSKAL